MEKAGGRVLGRARFVPLCWLRVTSGGDSCKLGETQIVEMQQRFDLGLEKRASSSRRIEMMRAATPLMLHADNTLGATTAPCLLWRVGLGWVCGVVPR